MTQPELVRYYGARASEYEAIYEKPERQPDLQRLRRIVSEFATQRNVLEIACGTGYWTEVLAGSAQKLTAIDASPEVLAVARAKGLGSHVVFHEDDAYALANVSGRYDAVFVGFWWSHIPHAAISQFLDALHRRLPGGARVMVLDNRYVEGSSTPIARTDADGNTYQHRRLRGGSAHEVLKNFPTPGVVAEYLQSAGGVDVAVAELPYYWYATYTLRPRDI
jgi:protein-L-isoaspartate O-methyltransferase